MSVVTKTMTDKTGDVPVAMEDNGAGLGLMPIQHMDAAQFAALVAATAKFLADDGVTVRTVSATYRLPVDAQIGPSGPITEADGANVTLGAKADAAWSGAGDATAMAALKTIATSSLDTSPALVDWATAKPVSVTTPLFGRYNSSPATASSGAAVEIQTDSKGHVGAALYIPGSASSIAIAGDTATPVAASATANKYVVRNHNFGYYAGNYIPTNLDSVGNTVVVGAALNDGTVAALGGKHLTMGGVDDAGNYRPFSISTAGYFHTEGGSASGATAVGNPFGAAGVYNANPTLSAGQRNEHLLTATGQLQVALTTTTGGAVAVNSSAGADGQTNTTNVLATRSYQSVYNGSTWDRKVKPNAVVRLASAAATTNSTLVKAGAGNVYNIIGYNAAATLRYLKLYNAVAAPTVGTNTPFLTLALPPTALFSFSFPEGLYCDTGIGFGLTTGVTNSDTGALTLADVTALNIVYA